MTSLVVPIACWNSYPKSTFITSKASFLNAQGLFTLAIAYASGHIWIYETRETQMKPKLLLLGHSSQVTAMTIGQVEIESLVDKSQVIVTTSEDGEINLWDLSDGHCIANSSLMIHGGLTKILFSLSNKYLLCSGNSNRLYIIEALSLDTLKSFDLCRNWISTMTLGFDDNGTETLITSSFDNWLDPLQFDEATLSFKSSAPVQHTSLMNKSRYPTFLISVSEYDRNLILSVNARTCEVYHYAKNQVLVLSRIECSLDSDWNHGFFASEREIVLLSSNGKGFVYYLGPASDIELMEVPDVNTIVDRTMREELKDKRILMTNRNRLLLTRNKKFGIEQYPFYHSVTQIAVLDPPAPMSNMEYFVLSENRSSFVIYAFGQDSGIDKIIKWPLCIGASLECSQWNSDTNIAISSDFQWNLKDLWPLSNEHLSRITSAITSEQSIILGYDDGSIRMIPESLPLFCSPSEIQSANHGLLMQSHRNKIVYLFTETSDLNNKRLLISACLDCSIKIWNLETVELLESFDNQTSPVECIVPFPVERNTPRNRKKIICLTTDFAVTIFDLEDLTCKNRFIHQSSPITAIHYRSADDLFAIACESGNVDFWQFKTGFLDRREEGQTAKDILTLFEAGVSIAEYEPCNLNKNIKQTLNVYPVYSKTEEFPPVLVFMVNIKRLIHDIDKGSHTITPITSPNLSQSRSRSIEQIQHRRTASSGIPSLSGNGSGSSLGANSLNAKFGTLSPGKRLMNMAAAIRVKSTLPNLASSLLTKTTPQKAKSNLQTTKIASSELYSSKKESASNALDISLIQAIFASLMTWALDEKLDQMCKTDLGLISPGAHVVYGMRGAAGNLSFMVPQNKASSKSAWEITSSMTAARLMNIVSLIQSVLKLADMDEETIVEKGKILHQHYLTLLPNIVGLGYCHPSFSVLARHWQDPITPVQNACRSLLSAALDVMPDPRRLLVLAFWRKHLPAYQFSNTSNGPQLSSVSSNIPPLTENAQLNKIMMRKSSKVNFRSAVIMAILCSSKPEYFSSKDTREIALSIEFTMREDLRGAYRLTAIELIAFGFSIWEPFLNGSNVLRYLLSLTGFVEPVSKTDAIISAPAFSASSHLEAAIMFMAKNSILSIAKINPPLFIQTLVFDLSHVKSMADRAGWLRLLSFFVSKESLFLYIFLPTLMESMIKALDPNIPHMRELLLPSLTLTMAEMVKTYPNVAFSAHMQRLIVGNEDGTCTLYDVKTATKLQILEGHTKSVNAVAFSSDGKQIATLSLQDATIKIWQPAGGLLGALAGAFGVSQASSQAGGGSGMGTLKLTRSFSIGSGSANVKFEWTAEKNIKFVNEQGKESIFQV